MASVGTAVGTEVGIRDLRNNTKAVIDLAHRVGEVVITSHGTRVATLRPLGPANWATRVDQWIADLPPAQDTGLTALLASDDAATIAAEQSRP